MFALDLVDHEYFQCPPSGSADCDAGHDCDHADGARGVHDVGAHDDAVSSAVSLLTGVSALAGRSLLGAHCTHHKAKQQ